MANGCHLIDRYRNRIGVIRDMFLMLGPIGSISRWRLMMYVPGTTMLMSAY
jgi:hypothetical protein